ncbi:hypothetical protein B0H13DRAFT_2312838 [Mycena leptocephala]|nr:hypothetical protein B0H13DRAFT_2312838 [Mycena leptocephala]
MLQLPEIRPHPAPVQGAVPRVCPLLAAAPDQLRSCVTSQTKCAVGKRCDHYNPLCALCKGRHISYHCDCPVRARERELQRASLSGRIFFDPHFDPHDPVNRDFSANPANSPPLPCPLLNVTPVHFPMINIPTTYTTQEICIISLNCHKSYDALISVLNSSNPLQYNMHTRTSQPSEGIAADTVCCSVPSKSPPCQLLSKVGGACVDAVRVSIVHQPSRDARHERYVGVVLNGDEDGELLDTEQTGARVVSAPNVSVVEEDVIEPNLNDLARKYWKYGFNTSNVYTHTSRLSLDNFDESTPPPTRTFPAPTLQDLLNPIPLAPDPSEATLFANPDPYGHQALEDDEDDAPDKDAPPSIIIRSSDAHRLVH